MCVCVCVGVGVGVCVLLSCCDTSSLVTIKTECSLLYKYISDSKHFVHGLGWVSHESLLYIPGNNSLIICGLLLFP